MNTNFDMVRQFMQACDQPISKTPELSTSEVNDLRIKLINEEFLELLEAIYTNDIVEVADALTDLLYVIYGAGHTFGINLDSCFEEVHLSNMTKVGPGGKVIKNASGKVIKPETYIMPNLKKILFPT